MLIFQNPDSRRLLRRPAQDARRKLAGFTLVEVLIALVIMALLAAMSWRVLDSMVRAHEGVRRHDAALAALQGGLAQWHVDLDAMLMLDGCVTLNWDGRVLRLTRSTPQGVAPGVMVVAWTLRGAPGDGRWLRWQSAPLHTQAQWRQAWQQASQWAQGASISADGTRAGQAAVTPATEWQIYYWRSNAWVNPLSSLESAAETGNPPAAIRLVLTLPQGEAVSGRITSDWVGPGSRDGV